MTPTQQALAERIRTAFAGITCGESLGYMSGAAADGPCTEKYLRVFMQREERRDWTAITPDTDQQCALMELAYAYAAKHGITL